MCKIKVVVFLYVSLITGIFITTLVDLPPDYPPSPNPNQALIL